MNAKDDLQQRWWNLEAKLVERFGKKPDLETILFLIGVQEFGDIKGKIYQRTKTGPDAYRGLLFVFPKRLL
jgi:hypothetical protein